MQKICLDLPGKKRDKKQIDIWYLKVNLWKTNTKFGKRLRNTKAKTFGIIQHQNDSQKKLICHCWKCNHECKLSAHGLAQRLIFALRISLKFLLKSHRRKVNLKSSQRKMGFHCSGFTRHFYRVHSRAHSHKIKPNDANRRAVQSYANKLANVIYRCVYCRCLFVHGIYSNLLTFVQ